MDIINFALFTLIALCFLCLYRVIAGPSIADRVVAIDIFGIIVVGVCIILAIKTGKSYLVDIGIAWIILSFIGTITLAKYLGKQKLND
jgi:multicomponent Na+:H+ antiporter subunit F